jgi:hypothetical protein
MQSGFRAGHGCTSATLKVLNDIITTIDKKKQYCAAVLIDLAKAFDCQSPHSYQQTQQPCFLKQLPRLAPEGVLHWSPPKPTPPFTDLSFQVSAAKDWNELQKSLHLETNFKHQLSEQLTDHCT